MKTTPPVKLEPSHETTSLLVCPHCGDTQLHQERVRTFFPDLAFAETGEGTAVYSSHGEVMIDRDMEDNPSYVRAGMTVHFDCEGCREPSGLAIYQHKGQTMVKWLPLGTTRY